MATEFKVLRHMHMTSLANALLELERENDVNATVNASLPARVMADTIKKVRVGVTHAIAFAEEMRYPDVPIAAVTDGEKAVLEMAILEYAWTVTRNFPSDTAFSQACFEMVEEWDQQEWRKGPVI